MPGRARRKGNYMFIVFLDNGSCTFDSADGFKTLTDAKAWATGRGGEYHIMINDDAKEYPDAQVVDCWEKPDGSHVQQTWPGEWEPYDY